MARDKSPPTKEELDDLAERSLPWLLWYRILKPVPHWLGVALCLFVAVALPVYWGAGEDTQIGVFYGIKGVIDFATEAKLSCKISWGVSILLLGAWRLERHVGQKAIHREHSRKIIPAETKIDPKRTSSNWVEVRREKEEDDD